MRLRSPIPESEQIPTHFFVCILILFDQLCCCHYDDYHLQFFCHLCRPVSVCCSRLPFLFATHKSPQFLILNSCKSKNERRKEVFLLLTPCLLLLYLLSFFFSFSTLPIFSSLSLSSLRHRPSHHHFQSLSQRVYIKSKSDG